MSRNRHLSVRAPRVQVVRHGVAGDRSIAVGRQPPVEHESGAGGTSCVQDGWFRGHCSKTILYELYIVLEWYFQLFDTGTTV